MFESWRSQRAPIVKWKIVATAGTFGWLFAGIVRFVVLLSVARPGWLKETGPWLRRRRRCRDLRPAGDVAAAAPPAKERCAAGGFPEARGSALGQLMLERPDIVVALSLISGGQAALRLGVCCRTLREATQPLPLFSPKLDRAVYLVGGRMGDGLHDLVWRLPRQCLAEGWPRGQQPPWEALPPMPLARCACAAAVAGQSLYVIGGYASGRDLDSVEVFSPAPEGGGRWSAVAPLPTARSACCAAVVAGPGPGGAELAVIVAGGTYLGLELGAVERLGLSLTGEPLAGQFWERMVPLPQSRSACAGAVPGDGCLYVLGGFWKGQSMPSVERFEPLSGDWKAMPPLRWPRWCAAATSTAECVIVAGGFSGWDLLPCVERFDLASGCWEDLPAMRTGRKWCGAVAAAGSILVFGGHDGRAACSSAERTSGAAKGHWSLLPSGLPGSWEAFGVAYG